MFLVARRLHRHGDPGLAHRGHLLREAATVVLHADRADVRGAPVYENPQVIYTGALKIKEKYS